MIKVCTQTFDCKDPSGIETYIKLGGYSAWREILNQQTPKSQIIETIKDSKNYQLKKRLRKSKDAIEAMKYAIQIHEESKQQ